MNEAVFIGYQNEWPISNPSASSHLTSTEILELVVLAGIVRVCVGYGTVRVEN